jgi:hypothetical protein
VHALALSVWALAHGAVTFAADGTAEALRSAKGVRRYLEATARHAARLVEAA